MVNVNDLISITSKREVLVIKDGIKEQAKYFIFPYKSRESEQSSDAALKTFKVYVC